MKSRRYTPSTFPSTRKLLPPTLGKSWWNCFLTLVSFVSKRRAGAEPDLSNYANIELAPDYLNRFGIGFGDCKTNDNLVSFARKMSETLRGNMEGRTELHEKLLKAAERVIMLPGDFHTNMHMLEAIFDLFYGGFLQVFQRVVQYRNIKKDPKDRLQKSADFLDIVATQLKRELYLDWLKCEEKRFSNPVTAAKAFLQFQKYRAKASDVVVQYTMIFLGMYDVYQRFAKAVRIGDSITIEASYFDFLPYYIYCGKHHYVELVCRQADDLYERMSPEQLHLARCNRGVRYNKGRAKSANDEVCEHFNADYDSLPVSKDMSGLVSKSALITPMRQSKRFAQYLTGQGVEEESCPKDKCVAVPSEEAPSDEQKEVEYDEWMEPIDPSSEETEEDPVALLDEDDIDFPTLTLRPLDLKSTTKPARLKDRMKVSEAIQANSLFTPSERTVDDFDMWAGTDCDAIDAAVAARTNAAGVPPPAPPEQLDQAAQGDPSHDEQPDSLDLNELMRTLLGGDIAGEFAGEADEDDIDEEKEEATPVVEEATVVVSGSQMKKYGLRKEIIKKPPLEHGLKTVRDGSLQRKREAKKENERTQMERAVVGAQLLGSTNNAQLDLQPVIPGTPVLQYRRQFDRNRDDNDSSTASEEELNVGGGLPDVQF